MALDMHKILSDTEHYKDDVTFKIGDEEVKLGDLRAGVNARIGDLTKREQTLAERERANEVLGNELRTAASRYATAAGTERTNPSDIPFGYSPEQWAALQADPYTAPLVKTIATLAKSVENIQGGLKTREQQEEQRYLLWQIEEISKKDERYRSPAERQALLTFTMDLVNKRDLNSMYRLRHMDEEIEKARKAAREEGIAEGRKTPAVPAVPYGTRAIAGTPKEEKLPATFGEFADQAAADQSLIQEIRESAGP